MVNREIIDYVSDGLARGFDIEEVRQQLLSQKYKDYDIDGAINELFPPKEEEEAEDKEEVEKNQEKSISEGESEKRDEIV